MRKHTVALFALALTSSIGCASVPRRPVAPDLVALDGALANRFVPAAERSDVVARIRLSVPSTAMLQRPPINVALVIDTSPHPGPAASELAQAMAARCVALPHAQAARLSAAVREEHQGLRKGGSGG